MPPQGKHYMLIVVLTIITPIITSSSSASFCTCLNHSIEGTVIFLFILGETDYKMNYLVDRNKD